MSLPGLWCVPLALTTCCTDRQRTSCSYHFPNPDPLDFSLFSLPPRSLIKRAPKSKIKRKTYTVPGPGVAGSKPTDDWAKEIATYFRK